MNKEQQDKIWNELSEESQKKIQQAYLENIQEAHNSKNSDEMVNVLLGKNEMLIDLFGYDNLNPKPLTPKTWEDVEKEGLDEFEYELDKSNSSKKDSKIAMKCQATLKIAKLIELSYGGMVSDEEWKDSDVEKWCIIPCNKINDIQRVVFYFHSDKRFIAFHTEQQAEEFMSYESNRQLVKQYHMM